jgi:hypothetical protein
MPTDDLTHTLFVLAMGLRCIREALALMQILNGDRRGR